MKKIFIIFAMLAAMSANAQWVQTSLPNIRMQCLSNCFGKIYAGTLDSGIYVSSNNGTNWVKSTFSNTRVNCIYPFGNNLFAGTAYNGVFNSLDSGKNWTQTELNNNWISSIISFGNNIFAGGYYTGRGIFKSSNNGINWIRITDYWVTVSMAVSGNNMIANVYRVPLSSDPNGSFYSSNQGVSWIHSDSIETAWCYMSKGNLLYAGIGPGTFLGHYGVRMSTNNGASWINLTSFNNKSIYYMEYYGNNLFAGSTDQGVYASNNNFSTWRRINEGLTDTITKGLLIKDGYLFMGTENHGVWKRPLSEITFTNNISTETPSKYSLTQNYPNPFNPTTNIKFSIVNSGDLKLVVYDIQGRKVQTLVNERLQPGTYETAFDGSMLTSGIYFYRLVTNSFTETKKMLLIK